ncbi:MAG: hypothetical protein R3B53_00990 [Candidatus Paceibacterota bacterium]
MAFGVSLYWQYDHHNNENNTTENTPLMIYKESEVKRAIDSLELRKTEYATVKASLMRENPVTPNPTETSDPLVERESEIIESEDSEAEIKEEPAEETPPEDIIVSPSFRITK